MKNKIKIISMELVWLAVSALVTFLIATFLFSWTFFKGTTDIHL